jgi:hypothetical protein
MELDEQRQIEPGVVWQETSSKRASFFFASMRRLIRDEYLVEEKGIIVLGKT